MGRKCRTIGEITLMEIANVGVRTRAMAATETVKVKKKRRRLNDDEEAQVKVTSSTTSYIQLRSRRILVDHRRKENRCSSHNSDHDDDVSCCSSNIGSSEKRIIELPDLEDESIEVETSPYFSSRESSSMNSSRRETTPSSELRAEPEDQDSMSKPSEVNSRRRSTVEKINPIKAEIEEFFASAEKDLQKHFTEKYNFDFVKEEPLEGRYEWVRLKPLGKSQNEKIGEKSNE
ncbi:PREDICTED: cyclin-dependent kinase inhibitor 7 isoform X1 [Theobroma cacao]|uniref:Cyclin-dependent kinase inhibitor 7 isoform X1 n=1 Tax=Theobroma cacao TaxID=3641 RepID=A0AB32WS41_THECC|nr:PREDICTED: cyclin-dependent kinase inhibitor 7 isoform X1 [Theobroma cacao]